MLKLPGKGGIMYHTFLCANRYSKLGYGQTLQSQIRRRRMFANRLLYQNLIEKHRPPNNQKTLKSIRFKWVKKGCLSKYY